MNKKITKNQLVRLAKMSRMIWSKLTIKEQETWYATDGSFGFLEQMVCLLKLNDVTITQEEWEFVNEFMIGDTLSWN